MAIRGLEGFPNVQSPRFDVVTRGCVHLRIRVTRIRPKFAALPHKVLYGMQFPRAVRTLPLFNWCAAACGVSCPLNQTVRSPWETVYSPPLFVRRHSTRKLEGITNTWSGDFAFGTNV